MISLEVGFRSVDCFDMVFQGERIDFFYCDHQHIDSTFVYVVAPSLHIFYIPVLFTVQLHSGSERLGSTTGY
jgi:hypothetical protein